MIPADAHLEVAWLPVADVVPDPPQSLELAKVVYYADLMRDSDSEGHLAPVLVNARDRDCAHHGRYRIRDGRHRWAAHVALGRARIRCVVVTEPAPCPAH